MEVEPERLGRCTGEGGGVSPFSLTLLRREAQCGDANVRLKLRDD